MQQITLCLFSTYLEQWTLSFFHMFQSVNFAIFAHFQYSELCHFSTSLEQWTLVNSHDSAIWRSYTVGEINVHLYLTAEVALRISLFSYALSYIKITLYCRNTIRSILYGKNIYMKSLGFFRFSVNTTHTWPRLQWLYQYQ